MSYSPFHHFVRIALVLITLLLMQACSSHFTLFSGLSEEDGNEIYAQLLAAQIPAEKTKDKNGIQISVPQPMASTALTLIQSKGLPRDKKQSLGEVFKKDGPFSSPLEERVRYLHALSQELEDTLMRMDGVLSAKVHIVLPEKSTPGEPLSPSSAAVFVKYTEGATLPAYLPRIREMIFNSIPGITGDPHSSISVAAIPSVSKSDGCLPLVWYGPVAMAEQDRFYFLAITYLVILLWVLSLGLVWLQAKDVDEWPALLNKLRNRIQK